MRLWLVRHGETGHNLEGVFQGQLDTPLTANGERQARNTADGLANIVQFDRIYCSDLSRALDTARALSEGQDAEPMLDARLREIHYGVLQGVAYADFRATLEQYGVDSAWGPGVFSSSGMAAPGGESLDDLVGRLSLFLNDLAAIEGTADDVALVAHGGSLRTIITMLIGLPPEDRHKLAMSNCGVTRLAKNGNQWVLDFHNRVYWS